MSRSFLYTLALTIAIATAGSAARAAGYDSGWQEQFGYRNSGTFGYEDNSYSTPRVIHRVRVRYTNSEYTVRRSATVEPCH